MYKNLNVAGLEPAPGRFPGGAGFEPRSGAVKN